MKTTRLCIVGAILVAALAVPWLIHVRAEAGLRVQEESLHEQDRLLGELSAENERLSNLVARTESPGRLSEAERLELLKLRNAIGQLRSAIKEMEPKRRELQRLREGLDDLATNSQQIVLTALLADEMEVRRARVAQLKQWLEGRPEEKIPELQFVPELRWIRLTDRPWVETDEENRHTMSMLRCDGEMTFARMATKALQQFTLANNGQFPADLSQLKPYFESPVEDAILDRYQIVAAQSLHLQPGAVGDWVITQKAPVNPELDARQVINLRGVHPANRDPGRWDPLR
jgi:hypothetical protein